MPQTTVSASATLFNGCQITPCGLCWERPLYLKHYRNFWNNRDTQLLCSNFLSSSVLRLSFLWLSFVCSDTCSFSSLFIPPQSFYIFPQQSLRLACFHTPFSMLALGIPTVENSACFIWVWKQCANIACLYPLGGIMAAITHWCSTKADISLSLCWQTAYTSHCSVTLSLVSYFLFPSLNLSLSLSLSILSFVSLPISLHAPLLFAGIVQQG